MQIDNPSIIASESILLMRSDGTETMVKAKLGTPYQIDSETWACPAFLLGIDGRYPDIVSCSSLSALALAIRLVATRLGHQLEDDGQLLHPSDRTLWDVSVFGRF